LFILFLFFPSIAFFFNLLLLTRSIKGSDGAKRKEGRHHSSANAEKRDRVEKLIKDSRHSLQLPHASLALVMAENGMPTDWLDGSFFFFLICFDSFW
jgi:hypothetical protein